MLYSRVFGYLDGLVMTKVAEEGVRDAVGKNVGHDEDIKSIRAVMKQDDDLTKVNGPGKSRRSRFTTKTAWTRRLR
jgi:hypothetical protein